MLTLRGGPVEGTYAAKRAPVYLRGVVDAEGERDVLDLLEDTPRAQEQVYVYRRVGEAGHVHLRMSGAARRASGFYALADYEYLPDVDGEQVRERDAWHAWVHAQPEEAQE